MTQQIGRYSFFYKLVMIALVPSLVYCGLLEFDLLRYPYALGGVPGGGIVFRLVNGLLIGPGTILTGLLILRRTRTNVVGLLLILYGIGITGNSVRFDVESPGVAIAFFVTNFYNNAVQLPSLICLLFYFPNGQVYPRRAAGWISAFAVIQFFGTLIQMLASPSWPTFNGLPSAPNPLFMSALAPLNSIRIISFAAGALTLPALVPAVLSIFLRYRASGALERLQIRWLALFAALFAISILGWIVAFIFSFFEAWRLIFYLVGNSLPALAIGNAILRHRLYDIDIIIRRTLIYAVLTTILAAVYFGSVVLVQQVFRAVTGPSDDLAIVISTLAIAALFTPLRRRIQNVIDRRLYRRKYDVEKTLEVFNRTLRDEVDLETLKQSLISVVNDTMQPTKIALWVKE